MVGTVKEWAGYKRCPFYDPVCKHLDPAPPQDCIGMCKYYYFELASCSNADRCDSYGWVAASMEEVKRVLLALAGSGSG